MSCKRSLMDGALDDAREDIRFLSIRLKREYPDPAQHKHIGTLTDLMVQLADDIDRCDLSSAIARFMYIRSECDDAMDDGVLDCGGGVVENLRKIAVDRFECKTGGLEAETD